MNRRREFVSKNSLNSKSDNQDYSIGVMPSITNLFLLLSKIKVGLKRRKRMNQYF